MKISKPKSTKFAQDSQFVNFKGKYFGGIVWDDGSGDFYISVNKNDEPLFCRDDGKYKDKLEFLQEEIQDTSKKLKILKRVYTEASKLDIKKVFKNGR